MAYPASIEGEDPLLRRKIYASIALIIENYI